MVRSGVVLAGGRSTRFGERDKALEPLAGTPMVRRVADRLVPVVGEVVVNCREDQDSAVRDALDGLDAQFRVATDRVPDTGPVGGIRTGLRAARGEYAAVVACDMPFVDPGFVDYLFTRAAGADGAVPRPDEYFEVTQAVYRTDEMAAACTSALDADRRKVLAPLDELTYEVVEADDVRANGGVETFRNVNTREEFEAAAAVIRDGEPDCAVGGDAENEAQ